MVTVITHIFITLHLYGTVAIRKTHLKALYKKDSTYIYSLYTAEQNLEPFIEHFYRILLENIKIHTQI